MLIEIIHSNFLQDKIGQGVSIENGSLCRRDVRHERVRVRVNR